MSLIIKIVGYYITICG